MCNIRFCLSEPKLPIRIHKTPLNNTKKSIKKKHFYHPKNLLPLLTGFSTTVLLSRFSFSFSIFRVAVIKFVMYSWRIWFSECCFVYSDREFCARVIFCWRVFWRWRIWLGWDGVEIVGFSVEDFFFF